VTDTSLRLTVLRGVIWGAILSLGIMTKINFLYFLVLIVPVLVLIRLRLGGFRSAIGILIGLVMSLAPATVYLVRHGREALDNAKGSSFGSVASFYYSPLHQYLAKTLLESPGLAFDLALVIAGLVYLVVAQPTFLRRSDLLPLVIVIGFAVIVLLSANRQIRYAFPAIVSLPFLIAILLSGRESSMPGRAAAMAASIVFGCLLAATFRWSIGPTGQKALPGVTWFLHRLGDARQSVSCLLPIAQTSMDI
jgi:hypothetical protein